MTGNNQLSTNKNRLNSPLEFCSPYYSSIFLQLLDLLNELLEIIASNFKYTYELNLFAQTGRHLYLLFNRAVYDLDVKGSYSRALNWALQHSSLKIAERALQAGASPHRCKGRRPITVAVMNGHEDLVRRFLEEDVDYNDEMPLAKAAEDGHSYH